MEITEVRIKLVERPSERLRAFCSITLDGDFVIRDLKIIDGTSGAFVAMPSRKLADRCPRCGSKNHLRAKFCNECGAKLNENRAPKDQQGRAKLHADVAHPINAECRERIQAAVVKAFEAELEKAKSPDYKPAKYDDFDVDLDEAVERARHHQPAAAPPSRASNDSDNEPAPASRQQPPPPRKPAETPDDADADFSDYNSLIAELKRDAEGRRERHEDTRGGRREPAPVQNQGFRPRQEGPRGPERPPRADRPGNQGAPTQSESNEGAQPPAARGQGDWGRERNRGPRPERAASPPRRESAAPPPPPPPPPPPQRREPETEDDFSAGL